MSTIDKNKDNNRTEHSDNESEIEIGRAQSSILSQPPMDVVSKRGHISKKRKIDGSMVASSLDDDEKLYASTKLLINADLDDSPSTPAIGSWKSIRNVVQRRLEPVASSTPMIQISDQHIDNNSLPNFDGAFSTRSISATSSFIDDPVLYYGAPLPGTSVDRREGIFREAFSIDNENSTPTVERVQEAPTNLSDFVPKLTSTADGSRELDSRSIDRLSMSPIL